MYYRCNVGNGDARKNIHKVSHRDFVSRSNLFGSLCGVNVLCHLSASSPSLCPCVPFPTFLAKKTTVRHRVPFSPGTQSRIQLRENAVRFFFIGIFPDCYGAIGAVACDDQRGVRLFHEAKPLYVTGINHAFLIAGQNIHRSHRPSSYVMFHFLPSPFPRHAVPCSDYSVGE